MQQTAYNRIASEQRQGKKKVVATSKPKKRTLVDLLKDIARGVAVFLFNQVGVGLLLVVYNVIGAYSFQSLEGVHGDASVEDKADSAQGAAVTLLWNLTVHLNILEESLWRREAEEAVSAYQGVLVPLIRKNNYRGVRPLDAWTTPGALMYSLSIYTTIGYGNLTPRTPAGKVATIVYALLGLPLMLLYMSNVGEILAKVFKFLYFKVCSCGLTTIPSQRMNEMKANYFKSSHREPPIRSEPLSAPVKRESARADESLESGKETIPILWCLVIITVYVVSGGILFAHWEGWSVMDGCYFCYISLSTVGFGDLVPGKVLTDDDGDNTDVETIQILATIYLLVGMALVAMCFNLMQEEALQNVKAFWRSLGCLRRSTEDAGVPKVSKERQMQMMVRRYYARAKENASELQPIQKIKGFAAKKSGRIEAGIDEATS